MRVVKLVIQWTTGCVEISNDVKFELMFCYDAMLEK